MKIISYDIGINNLAYCVLNINTNEQGDNVNPTSADAQDHSIINWGIIDLRDQSEIVDLLQDTKGKKTKKGKKKKINLDNILLGLYNYLDGHDELTKVDKVLIENQPCMKNPTMKSVQIIVYSYYMRLKMVSPTMEVRFISALNKLKKFKPEDYGLDLEKYKSKYTRRKKLGVAACKALILDNNEMLEFYNSSKKKDDLADTYLQAHHYINNNKLT